MVFIFSFFQILACIVVGTIKKKELLTMKTANNRGVDPILELLGLAHLYRGRRPLVWIPDLYPKPVSTPLKTDEQRETKSNSLREKVSAYGVGSRDPGKTGDSASSSAEVDLSEYFVDTREDGPYASLLTDETFKKAFSPDTEQGKCNLLNLLNDMLEGQIPHRIIDMYSQQLEQNESGSKESRTSIFDLHCRDEVGDFIEIEVQIRKKTNFLKRLAFYSGQMIVKQGIPGDEWNYDVKPTYVIAITKHRVFDDDRTIHRAGIVDYATNKPIVDSVNFTVVELPKVGRIIRENDAEAAKWMFALKYLNRIKRLPPALNEGKFKGLLLSAKVARFNKEELERYRYTMKMEWDDYAEWTALVEDHPEYLKEAEQKAVDARDSEIAQMLDDGMTLEKLREYLRK